MTSKFNDDANHRNSAAEPEEPLAAGSVRLLQGRYRVDRVLGEREGIVTALAHDRSTSAQVVLRQLTSNSSWDDDQIEERAAAVAQLGSEHTVRLASWFPGKGGRGFYFVFDHLQGENLGIVLERRGRLEIAAAADYLLQACDALAEAHALGLVHGSVRSTSLFLSGQHEREQIKLLDFELAPWGADEGERPTLPPELLQGSPRAGPHSDIWALGVVLYQLVTGELPFASGNGQRSSSAPSMGNPRSIWQIDLSATPSAALRTLEQVTERCLSRHVSDRFTSVMELALRLLPLAPPDSIGQRLWRGRLKRSPMYPERNYRKTPGASGIEVRGPFLRTGADGPSEPLLASRSRSGSTPLLDGVQLSVFRPRRVQPGLDYRVLAFVHRNRFANAPDPLDEVQRQAEQMLEQASADEAGPPLGAAHGVPHESSLTFVPLAEGVEFIPPRRTIRWRDGVQRAEFRLRAGSGVNSLRRGRVSVYLGALLIGDVPLQLRVTNDAPVGGEIERVSAPAYRKIYAACSGLDDLIAGQLEALSGAFAESFLTDLNELRSSEQWSQRLAEMIREADVFQLFWSENAMSSAFLRGEWEYALALGRTGDFIRPVYWDLPRPEAPGLPPPHLARLHFQYVGAQEPPLTSAETDQTLRVPRPAELERLALAPRSRVYELALAGVARVRQWASKRPLFSAPRLLMAASLALGIGLLLWRQLSEPPPHMIAFDEPVPVLMFALDLSREKALAAAEGLRDRAAHEADPAQPPVMLFVRGTSHGVAIGPFTDLEAAREARRRSTLGSSLVLDLWGECIQYPLFLGTVEGFPTYFCQPPPDPSDD